MTGPRGRLTIAITLVACLAATALSGCREDEQERVLLYNKGTYQGASDQDLDQSQLGALRFRASNQKF